MPIFPNHFSSTLLTFCADQRLHPDSRVIHTTSEPIQIGHSVTNTFGVTAGEEHVNAHVEHSRGTSYKYPSTSELSLTGLFTSDLTLRLVENEVRRLCYRLDRTLGR